MGNIRSLWESLIGLWLRSLSHSAWITGFLLPLLLVAVARLVLVGLGVRTDNVQVELLLDISIATLSVIFIWVMRSVGLGSMLPKVQEIAATAHGPHRGLILDFANRRLGEMAARLAGLVSSTGPGMIENITALDQWTRLFFEFAHGKYDGADSHVPSDYYKVYVGYLQIHEAALQRGFVKPGTRILLTTDRLLTRDWLGSAAEYQNFLSWHVDHKVELKWVDPVVARGLQESHGLRTAEVGIWNGNYAVFFEPIPEKSQVGMRIAFAGQPDYVSARSYLRELEMEASPVERVPLQRPIGRVLASQWSDYVRPDKRLGITGRLAPFLLRELAPYEGEGTILDAAAGIACDSLFLMEAGFGVTSNEIDGSLTEAADRYVKQHSSTGRTIDLERCHWERLTEMMPGGRRFDAALVIGNSICLVEPSERLGCVRQFFKVLNPGGKIIIDERNFRYIMSLKGKVPASLPDGFRCSWEVMYCGEKVRGCPWEVMDDRILWRIYRNDPRPKNSREIEAARIGDNDLTLYPLGRGELEGLLRDAGFTDIERYADLEPLLAEPNARSEQESRADFFTYTALKPRGTKPLS